MNIVIVGYGRVGSALAEECLSTGHRVTILDVKSTRVQRAARLLPGARVVSGSAVDVQVQREAGVSEADLFCALTSNDNVNLVAAQVALEVFQVPNVVARVYAPSRAEVLGRQGIIAVCPTSYAIDTVREQIANIAKEAAPRDETRKQRVKPPSVQPVDENKFVVVLGGGRVGFHLVRSLRAAGHEVVVIEKDPLVYNDLIERLDCPVIIGDGSMRPTLEEAGATRARVFAAVTGYDEDNLVACQTVKLINPKSKTIARVSDPHNEDLYRTLGVDATVSATSIIEGEIERELPTLRSRTLMSIAGGNAEILEVVLVESAPVVGHPLRDVVLPREANIIAILRGAHGEKTVIPRGDTIFQPADTVLALVAKPYENDLKRTLLGDETKPAAAESEHG